MPLPDHLHSTLQWDQDIVGVPLGAALKLCPPNTNVTGSTIYRCHWDRVAPGRRGQMLIGRDAVWSAPLLQASAWPEELAGADLSRFTLVQLIIARNEFGSPSPVDAVVIPIRSDEMKERMIAEP
jgi:hypothetical protein